MSIRRILPGFAFSVLLVGHPAVLAGTKITPGFKVVSHSHGAGYRLGTCCYSPLRQRSVWVLFAPSSTRHIPLECDSLQSTAHFHSRRDNVGQYAIDLRKGLQANQGRRPLENTFQ